MPGLSFPGVEGAPPQVAPAPYEGDQGHDLDDQFLRIRPRARGQGAGVCSSKVKSTSSSEGLSTEVPKVNTSSTLDRCSEEVPGGSPECWPRHRLGLARATP